MASTNAILPQKCKSKMPFVNAALYLVLTWIGCFAYYRTVCNFI